MPEKSYGEKFKTESVLISLGYVKDIESILFGGSEDDMAVVINTEPNNQLQWAASLKRVCLKQKLLSDN